MKRKWHWAVRTTCYIIIFEGHKKPEYTDRGWTNGTGRWQVCPEGIEVITGLTIPFSCPVKIVFDLHLLTPAKNP